MKKNISIITIVAVCILFTACSAPFKTTVDSVPEKNLVSFEGLTLIQGSEYTDRIVFDDLASLENFSDIAVVGNFVDNDVQDITYTYSDYFEKDIVTNVTAYNTVEVTKVLFGNVNIGDRLNISQNYGVVNEQLITFSALTPMQYGDEWVFFLKESEENLYCCAGDCQGRYPVPSAENAPMPLSDSPDLGVYSEQSFNRSIYDEILEKYDF